jgi:23S rRNA pseudouridine955/2504/2580 synthase
VVLVALNSTAFTAFHRALAEARVRKLYHVAVFGRPKSEQWTDTTPLRRLPHTPRGRPKVVAAPAAGELAQTHFRLLSSSQERSLLQAEPVSGRTHQIRAHLYASGLPLLGDPRYGDRDRERQLPDGGSIGHQMLHARRLELELDTRKLRVEAPYPLDLERALERLGLLAPA